MLEIEALEARIQKSKSRAAALHQIFHFYSLVDMSAALEFGLPDEEAETYLLTILSNIEQDLDHLEKSKER